MKLIFFLIFISFSFSTYAEEDDFAEEASRASDLNLEISGFVDFEQGGRVSGAGPAYSNGASKDYVLANRRLRLKSDKTVGSSSVYFMVDFNHDEVVDEFNIDIREAKLKYSIGEDTDISVGRQVSTWGVGDLIFINDLFPKNWIAHFSGRDLDMLKDPADSVRLTHYKGDWVFDLVVTPEFSPDSTPQGCKYEVFDPNSNGVIMNESSCGLSSTFNDNTNSFDDAEVALSVKKKVGGQEIALYGYRGFHKSPKGIRVETLPDSSTKLMGYHPRLEVYGLSSEGQVGPGILSFEAGYYNSKDDKSGDNFLIENSMLKYLVGYRMDLSSRLFFGFQWYQEMMMDYDEYEASYLTAQPANYAFRLDEFRDTFTLRLGFKAMNETLFVNWFSYVRPQDKDSFHKLEILKRVNDQVEVSAGANIFEGEEGYQDRNFGMLKDADNIFVKFKYIF